MKIRKLITAIFLTLIMNLSVLPLSIAAFKEEKIIVFNMEEDDDFLKRNRKKRLSLLMTLYYKILMVDKQLRTM